MTPLSIHSSELSSLDQTRGVVFVRKLLWAEAVKCRVSQKALSVPECINTADGGIDACITESDSIDDRLIPQGLVGYQVKTGTSAYSGEDCKKEIHKENKLDNELKPEVKRILDAGGTYFLILLQDITTQKEEICRKALKAHIKKRGYAEDKVRIVTPNGLANIAEEHLSVAIWLKQIPLDFIPFDTWEEQLNDGEFLFDEPRQKICDEIRDYIRGPQEKARMIRITGLPGIGKTRLVNKILALDEFRNRVLYVDNTEQFLSSSTCNTIRANIVYNLIIVLDDCDHSSYEKAQKIFSNLSDRVTVIALFRERTDSSPDRNTNLYEIGPLGEGEISKILSGYRPRLPDYLINRLAAFSEGYPRIAILLHESYSSDKSDFSENPRISEALFTRLVNGRYGTGSDMAEKNNRLLMWLSVFSKVGYKGKLNTEISWVCKKADVSEVEAATILAHQKERRILQGEYYVSVTPFMLKVHLINEWWKTYGCTPSFVGDMFNTVPEEMRHDFTERFFSEFGLAPRNAEVKQLAKQILNQEGFTDLAVLDSRFGSGFFLKLAKVAPDSALSILEKVVETQGEEVFGSLTEGRRSILYVIIDLLSSKETYKRAYNLVKILALHERESYANNSEGVAKDFFAIIPSYTFTEVAFEDRWNILSELLESEDPESRLFAIDACNAALKDDGFTRMLPGRKDQISIQTYDIDVKNLGKSALKVWAEVWSKLMICLKAVNEEERTASAKVLLGNAYSLSQIIGMDELIQSGLKELSKLDYDARKEALACVLRIIHYRGKEMDEEQRRSWTNLKTELTGTDFPSRLRRYVEMYSYEDPEEIEARPRDITQERLKELAKEVDKQPDLLDQELCWLVESAYPNAYLFGLELGKTDLNTSYLENIQLYQTQLTKKICLFFSGYLKAYHDRDPQNWEKYIRSILEEPKLSHIASELTWRSGLTEELGVLLIEKAEAGEIVLDEFSLFGLGGAFLKLQTPLVERMFSFLLEKSTEPSITNALDLAHTFYMPSGAVIAPAIPEKLILDLITHPVLFKGVSVRRNTMVDYYWTELSLKYLSTYPTKSLEIGRVIIEHFGQDGSILSGFHNETQKVINAILRTHPREMWQMISKKLGPPIDSTSFHLDRWLRGGDGFSTTRHAPIEEIPIQDLFAWVDQDVEHRAWYLAHFVTNQLFHDQSKPCYAREVLIKYGNREDVRRNLAANFSTEGFSGPASEHYLRKKNALLTFKQEETSANVLRWIDEYIESLDESIERARMEEEKRGW